jgi:pyruvate dehydrogenase E2 component (dihydrolipoamide acetyltransferase)
VIELETDKATVEVPTSVGGRVVKVHVKEGDKVSTGQVVFDLEAGAAEAPAAAPAKSAPAVSEAAPGAPKPAQAEPALLPAAAAAASVSRPARAEVVDIASSRPARPAAAPEPLDRRPPAPAAPSVRRLARELGLDIPEVKGSGRDGRISTDDVMAHAKQLLSAPAPGRVTGAPLPDFTKFGPVERKPMRAIRRKTAEHLSAAWNTIPHVTQCDKADITALEALRGKYAKRVETAGGKLTVTAIAVKVLATVLKVFPQFNASIDEGAEEIVQKGYVHVGVAVDTDRGLLVPVVRDADRKNVVQIAVEIADLAERARSKKITLEEMEGGSITVTNLGGFGGTYFTPIVNHPEVAILGVSRARMEPVYQDGTFEPRLMLPLSLSYDHRVIDGADGIRFLRWVIEALEQPFLLSLEG